MMKKAIPIRPRGKAPLRKAYISVPHSQRAAPYSLNSIFSSKWLQLVGVAAVAAPLFLFKLSTGSLLDWDEAIYAEVSKEMARSGNWLTPYWQGHPFFEKPPLSFWMQATLFHWFGVSGFWARFPSALAGIAIVLLTYATARRLAGTAAGIFAAFVLMTVNHFDRVVREGMTDALLCLCIYFVVYAWLRVRDGGPIWFYSMCAAVGAGAMIKGPAILVAPLAIAVDAMLGPKPERAVRWRQCCAGGLLALAIVTPWHILMAAEYGRPFLNDYFGYQLAARATGVIQGSGGGPAYYAVVVFYGAFPWSILALFAACRWIWRKESSCSLIWILAGILFIGYSLLPTKHPWYILPIYPALAIETGRLLSDAGRKWPVARYVSVAVCAIGVIAAFAKLSTRRGDPFTNHVAQLARLAGSSAAKEPLLMVTKPGPDPRLDVPTAVFYSNRTAMAVEMPGDTNAIASLLTSHDSVDAIVQDDTLGFLSQLYAVHRIAQNDSAAYVTISAKHSVLP